MERPRSRPWWKLLVTGCALLGCSGGEREKYCESVLCKPVFQQAWARFQNRFDGECRWQSDQARVQERCLEWFDRTWERLSDDARAKVRACIECLETTDFDPGACDVEGDFLAGQACSIPCSSTSVRLFDDNFWFNFPEPFICSPG